MSPPRTATIERTTRETSIRLALNLDGGGDVTISTGLGFFDHMLHALAYHARFDLLLTCQGDLRVDDHHTVEDVGLVLGDAINQSLGDRVGIRRFAHAYAPLDEALARCVIDLSGRPCVAVNLDLRWRVVGDTSSENLTHFFLSFATTVRGALHVDVLRGENDHHRAEAAFKATALALRAAVARDDRPAGVPSTKGTL